MSSSDSTGSSKPKQQLNISAKEWVPNKIISNLPQQHSTGNNYDYSQESSLVSGSNNNNNVRNRNDSYYNSNSQGNSHHRGGRDSHGRYPNSGTVNSNTHNHNQNVNFVPPGNPAVAMNVGINPYQTNAYLLQQQQYMYTYQAQYMNQGGYPAQMIPPMMMGSSPYYSQQSGVTGGDMYMPMNMIPSMVYPPPFGTGPLVGSAVNVAVPAVAPPTVLSSSSPPFISSEESPLEPVDLTADAHMQNLSTESSASFSNSTEAVGEPVAFEESSPSAVDDAAEEITGTVAQDHSESSVPTPDPQEKSSSESSCNVSVPSEGGEGESESRDQVYSRDALLSLYRPQSLPQSLLPFYPGLDPDGAKDPLQSGGGSGLGKEATALYLRSSPKSTGGAGVGGSRDFHKADSRDFSGHGSSAGRRDRDFRDTRDRDSRDREKDRNHGTVSMRVNTGFISGDGDGEDGQSSSAPSPQLFFGGSRRGGSSTPHPETPQDAATFGSSSAFGRSSVLSKSAESENSAEAIIKRATLILNKLSVTKFDKLSNEFLEIISTGDNDLLFKVVELLVTKAQMEEHFCFMYADLCRKICNVWEDLILDTQPGLCTSDVKAESTVRERDADKDNGEGEGEGGDGKQMTKGKLFRELLLDRCRMEFENDRVKGLEKIRAMIELTEEERLEKELLLKKRYTGHMRFIGEIYIKDLVLANIINEHCLSVLVQETDEEQLVCLCKLFQTVGDKIEKYYNKRARSKKGKERRYDEIIPGHFAAIEKIAQTHPISRVRFMLRDLIEMRANNWTARREEEKVMDLSETRTVVGQGIPAAARSGLGTVSSHPVAAAASDVHVPSTQASIPPPPAPLAATEDEWRTVTKSSKKEKGSTTTIPPASSSLSNKGSAAVGSGTGQSVKKSQQSSLGSPSKKAAGNTRSGSGLGLSKKSGEDKVVPISTSSSASSKSHAAAIVTAGAEEQSPVFEGDFPNSQQQSSPSPGTAQVLEAPISFAPMDGLVAKKVRSAVDEFYYNGLLEEVDAVLRELLILPTQTADLFKVLLLHVLEQKKDEVEALCLLLLDLSGGEKPLLSTRAIAVGLQNFLEDLDDICMDSPRANVHGAKVAGELMARGQLPLSFFAAIPTESLFRSSMRAADFVLQVIGHISAVSGKESARSLFRDAQIDLLNWVVPPPRQSREDFLDELVEKYGVRFVTSPADLT